jgi:hypothetical protein
LTRLANKGRNSKICSQDGGAEDVELGKCMKNLGVETVNSLDALGRHLIYNPLKNTEDFLI